MAMLNNQRVTFNNNAHDIKLFLGYPSFGQTHLQCYWTWFGSVLLAFSKVTRTFKFLTHSHTCILKHIWKKCSLDYHSFCLLARNLVFPPCRDILLLFRWGLLWADWWNRHRGLQICGTWTWHLWAGHLYPWGVEPAKLVVPSAREMARPIKTSRFLLTILLITQL